MHITFYFEIINHIINYLVAINIRTSGFILRRFQMESWSLIRLCVPGSPRRPKETKTTTYDEYDSGFIMKSYDIKIWCFLLLITPLPVIFLDLVHFEYHYSSFLRFLMLLLGSLLRDQCLFLQMLVLKN